MQIAASLRGTIRRHPGRWGAAAIVLVALVGFALYWFAPWNLLVDRRVDESIPSAGPQTAERGGVTAADADDGEDRTAGGEGTKSGTVTLARGGFSSLEHTTSGTAIVLELDDGSRFLRLEDLETSNGPDLRVILTDRPLSDDWHVWDDGAYVDLGALKGNLGSSNYEIPRGVDPSDYRTAVIWCRRFSVGFGVAPLDP